MASPRLLFWKLNPTKLPICSRTPQNTPYCSHHLAKSSVRQGFVTRIEAEGVSRFHHTALSPALRSRSHQRGTPAVDGLCAPAEPGYESFQDRGVRQKSGWGVSASKPTHALQGVSLVREGSIGVGETNWGLLHQCAADHHWLFWKPLLRWGETAPEL